MSQLRVNGIANSSGTSAITIDSAGRVDRTVIPAFHANSSGGTFANNQTLTFPTVKHNSGNHYNPSTGIFTAPVDGLYSFYTTMLTANGDYYIDYRVYLDDVMYGLGSYAGSQTGYKNVSATWTMTLNAGQTVQMKALGTATVHGDIAHNYFGGYLIG